jgi:hypothetical protein
LYRFILAGSYLNSTQRLRPTAEFSEKVDMNSEEYIGSCFYEMANDFSIGVSGFQSKKTFKDLTGLDEEASLARRLNREEISVNLEIFYPVFIESSFFIQAGYTEYDFQFPESRYKDSYAHQILSGINFPLLGKIRGTLSIGYKKLVPKERSFATYSGLIGNTNLEYQISRFGFRISLAKDIPFSLSEFEIYYNENSIGGGISYYLTDFLRLDYDIGLSMARYPTVREISLPDGTIQEIKRADDYITQRFGFVFRVAQNTGLGFKINFWERNSNLPGFNNNSKFIGFFLSSNF